MLEVSCPKCARAVPHLPEFVGKEAACIRCGTHFSIPSLSPDASRDTLYQILWMTADNAQTHSVCDTTGTRR
jgi:hypothetical protein